MAYYSGSASSFADIVTAIRNACTANGWTLSGEVLHKSTVYQRVWVNGNFIDSQGGTGIDGGNLLTGGSPSGSRVGNLLYIVGFVFPCNYEIFVHENPDEVFAVFNTAGDYYQWLAFGKSSVNLPGSGGWHSGSFGSGAISIPYGVFLGIPASADGHFGTRYDDGRSSAYCPGMFHSDNSGSSAGEHIHAGIPGWTNSDTSAAMYRAPLDYYGVNKWHDGAVLLPIQVYTTAYGAGKVAMVLDIEHARAVRIDNYQAGEIITIGHDRWKVFPWYKKAATEDYPGDTGRAGWAIRYDGG